MAVEHFGLLLRTVAYSVGVVAGRAANFAFLRPQNRTNERLRQRAAKRVTRRRRFGFAAADAKLASVRPLQRLPRQRRNVRKRPFRPLQ